MSRATISVLLALLVTAPPAEAAEFAVELSAGVGIPIASFPSFVPYAMDDPQGELFDVPNSAYNLLVEQKATPGFTGAVTLMLDNYSLRLAMSFHQWSEVRVLNYALLRIEGEDVADELHNVFLGNLLGDSTRDAAFDIPERPGFLMLRAALGYRWYLSEGWLRPYIPFGAGPAFFLSEGSVYGGIDLHTGLGVELDISPHWAVGLSLQYEYMGVFLPNDFQAHGLQGVWIATTTANRSVLDGFVQNFNVMQLALTFLYHL